MVSVSDMRFEVQTMKSIWRKVGAKMIVCVMYVAKVCSQVGICLKNVEVKFINCNFYENPWNKMSRIQAFMSYAKS